MMNKEFFFDKLAQRGKILMNKFNRSFTVFLLSLLFVYIMLIFTFKNENIFWYLYTFTLLVGMAVAILCAKFYDELPTWQYLIFGIGYGTIIYGFIWLGEKLLNLIYTTHPKDITAFLTTFGPQNIWHYLLLIFIIIIGEEIFWRAYIQQYLKQYVNSFLAVIITTFLFALSIAISGFIPGVFAAIVTGLILGFLYEWKKSLPLVIVAHIVFILLLFLVLPIA